MALWTKSGVARMQWLKDLVHSFPLEAWSEFLAQVVFWWIQQVEGVPEEKLALYTYLGGSCLVLLLMLGFLKIFPKALRAPLWIVAAAVLLTPGATVGDTKGNAPAIISVLHGFLMGEGDIALAALLPILAATVAGLIVASLWQLIKAKLAAAKEQAPIPPTKNAA